MTYRNIDTSMWKDEWFLELEPDEKLLFIYLFSNENTLLTGLYKLSLRVIEFETGLSKQFILDTIENKFSPANKVYYENGIIWVVNLRKYNDSKSPKVAARIKWELAQIPDSEIKEAYLRDRYYQIVDGLSGPLNTLAEELGSILSVQDTVSIEYPNSINTDSQISPLTIQTNTNQTKPVAVQQPAAAAFTKFQNEIGMLTPKTSEIVGGWIDDYSDAWACDAIDEAVRNNARKPAYIDAILKRWKADGRNGRKAERPFIPEEHASEVY